MNRRLFIAALAALPIAKMPNHETWEKEVIPDGFTSTGNNQRWVVRKLPTKVTLTKLVFVSGRD